ncbi:MAG: DUF459 domain-containing protein, partial [Hyphomicrobiaceae bacterium]|nr:DUF459 domain-containing protein [Hyphomicrobiaceae bacterium]
AADEDQLTGQGYLALYPTGDVYQVQVIGDWMAEGLKFGVTEAFRGDTRIQVRPKQLDFPGLMRGEFNDQVKALDDALGKDTPQVAVVMIGPQDRTSVRVGSKRLWIDSDEWRAEFSRQVDVVMKALKRRRIAVYWVSLPNVRKTEPNEDVQVINEIIREKAVLNGFKYIDAYAGFTDDGGGYSAMGPDLTGKIRLLREQNGIAFTDAGNRKLGHFVERELKRDLTQAKRERLIPLAGNEAEQAAIAAQRQAKQAIPRPVAGSAIAGVLPNTGQPTAAAGPSGPANNGDQRADSGRISIALSGPGGKEEIVSVDLLRPAIPASVLELVNKKDIAEKPTTLGDLLIDKIPGGVIVMSSISPAAEANALRTRLPPTQTPYFRVMVKGERVPVRADRSDDVSWPRPEPPPVEVIVPKTQPPVPAAAAPTPGLKPAVPGKDAPRARRSETERTR